MYVHPRQKRIYLAHPRTASTATSETLMGRGYERVGSHHDGLAETGWDPTGWFAFTAVRHPCDAVASWGFFHDAPWETSWWDEWLRSEVHVSADPPRLFVHAPDADAVLRYETLERDLARLGITGLERENVSEDREGSGWREVLPPEMQSWARETFAHETRRFGYEV